jgi:hypothetical protein
MPFPAQTRKEDNREMDRYLISLIVALIMVLFIGDFAHCHCGYRTSGIGQAISSAGISGLETLTRECQLQPITRGAR